MADIFVSYARADRILADRITEQIRAAGHQVFLDSDRENGIAPGTAWQRALFRELRICDAVVFLNSGASQASMWCHSELALAASLGKRVYPIDLGPGLAPHPLLQALQGIAFDGTIDTGIRRLIDKLALDGLADARPGPHGNAAARLTLACWRWMWPTPASSSAGARGQGADSSGPIVRWRSPTGI